jgi:hypothetical protein
MLQNKLRARLLTLHHPRLYEPLQPSMLNVNGTVDEDALGGIDWLLYERASREVIAWDIPQGLPSGASYQDRWRLVSSLQKAIRQGNVLAAMAAAHACHEIDERYLWRRLVVIALEDVMLGNLYAVATTLAFAGSKRCREIAGAQKTAVWMAAQLAGGLKDRSAVNLLVLVDYDCSLQPTMTDWAHLADANLSRKAADMALPIEQRMMAAWLLAGTKQFKGMNLPPDNDRPRWSLMRLMAESRMPLILYYIADRAAIRGGESMFVSLLPIWQIIERLDDEGFTVRTNVIPEGPSFGPILAAAYDMYTREGRQALRRFADLPAIASALAPIIDSKQRFVALCDALFTVEGGKLDRHISSDGLDDLHVTAIHLDLEYLGLPDRTDQAQLFKAIRSNLEALNGFRADALVARGADDPFGQLAF